MLMRTNKSLVLGAMGLVVILLFIGSPATGLMDGPVEEQWIETAPQGFGDRHNSTAWSMQWWRGKLYVGTLRSFVCWRAAILAAAFPGLADSFYPPQDPDADCTANPTDLSMQAEIWRWTPETDTWERVYQSPQNVPIPGYSNKYVARDTGFRGMLVFTDPDGTEALYVTGVSPREMYDAGTQMPPPRILRSTDGVTFNTIPQEPGTFLGDLEYTGLRSGTIHRGRMYLTNGSARGEGILIEAQDPAGGNNSFREVMPPETRVWDAISFHGFLYVGIVSTDGFSVVKTDALGTPPYSFTTIIAAGGYRDNPSRSIVSFQVFNDRLYVSTFLPAELYRINPDDTWELIMGEARDTPTGWKYPLSGLDQGFGWPFNVQIYRMYEYGGELYLGTLDISREVTQQFPDPKLDQLLSWHYGFDLYRTVDGQYFEPLTIDGFEDGFQIAARTFASSPYGLHLGTGSYWYGLKIWHKLPESRIHLPLIVASSLNSSIFQASTSRYGITTSSPDNHPACGPPPQRLEVESISDNVILSWERPPNTTRFRIFRSELTPQQLQISGLERKTLFPAPFIEVGTSDDFFFIDTDTMTDRVYYYKILAESRTECLSRSSNLARAPSLARVVSFSSLEKTVSDWESGIKSSLQSQAKKDMVDFLRALKFDLELGDSNRALKRLEEMRRDLAYRQPTSLPSWRVKDLEIVLAKLGRRIRLVETGLISPSDLN